MPKEDKPVDPLSAAYALGFPKPSGAKYSGAARLMAEQVITKLQWEYEAAGPARRAEIDPILAAMRGHFALYR